MLTHLCRDEPIQTASLIQHLVSPAASTLVLPPIDCRETSKLLVLAHVRSSIPTVFCELVLERDPLCVFNAE